MLPGDMHIYDSGKQKVRMYDLTLLITNWHQKTTTYCIGDVRENLSKLVI